jgi:hypothetical protein
MFVSLNFWFAEFDSQHLLIIFFTGRFNCYFLKYDERLLSLSFFALAPDCKPKEASVNSIKKYGTNKYQYRQKTYDVRTIDSISY